MKKSELSAHVATETSLSKAQASGVVDAVFSAISDALARDESVVISGFGTFSTQARAARQAGVGVLSSTRSGDPVHLRNRPDIRALTAAEAPPPLPRADSEAEAARRVNQALGLIGKTNWRRVRTPVDGVVLRRSLTPHLVGKFDAGEDRSRYAARILGPAMRDIADALEAGIEEAFQTQASPDGDPWASLPRAESDVAALVRNRSVSPGGLRPSSRARAAGTG